MKIINLKDERNPISISDVSYTKYEQEKRVKILSEYKKFRLIITCLQEKKTFKGKLIETFTSSKTDDI